MNRIFKLKSSTEETFSDLQVDFIGTENVTESSLYLEFSNTHMI